MDDGRKTDHDRDNHALSSRLLHGRSIHAFLVLGDDAMTDYTDLIARLRGLSSAARNPLIVADPLEHAAEAAAAAIAALTAERDALRDALSELLPLARGWHEDACAIGIQAQPYTEDDAITKARAALTAPTTGG